MFQKKFPIYLQMGKKEQSYRVGTRKTKVDAHNAKSVTQ